LPWEILKPRKLQTEQKKKIFRINEVNYFLQHSVEKLPSIENRGQANRERYRLFHLANPKSNSDLDF